MDFNFPQSRFEARDYKFAEVNEGENIVRKLPSFWIKLRIRRDDNSRGRFSIVQLCMCFIILFWLVAYTQVKHLIILTSDWIQLLRRICHSAWKRKLNCYQLKFQCQFPEHFFECFPCLLHLIIPLNWHNWKWFQFNLFLWVY